MKTGFQAVRAIKAALAEAGMPRTSNYAGAELTGWTQAMGSTGFSVRAQEDGSLQWHIVLSGEPHLAYRYYDQRQNGTSQLLHEPVNPEKLFSSIKQVFEALGLTVSDLKCSGHQTLWDDDVNYSITTPHPHWLEAAPVREHQFGGLFGQLRYF